MTIEQRYTQLRGLSLSRETINGSVSDLNKTVIANNVFDEKMIKEIFSEYIQNYSLDDIKNVTMKLAQFGSVAIAQDQISLVNQFYALMVHKVLLPDYLGDASPDVKKEELKAIIDRYMLRLDKDIEKIIQKPFHISMGDREALSEEINRVWGVSAKSLRPWWPFGSTYIGYDEDIRGHIICIPVTLSKGDGSTMVKTVEPEMIKKIVYSILPKKNKSTKKEAGNSNPFGGFEVTFETKVDRDCDYGRVPDTKYLMITISNKEIGDLSNDWYSNDEILKHLETFVELNDLMTNTIAEAIGTNGEKCYQSLAVTSPYLFRTAQESNVVDMTKFSKLMVRMKEKVYLEDVAGQEEAKAEVMEIVNILKHPDTMKNWGASPTSGIVFYGPPGTGKTLLAMLIATLVDAEVYNIKMTDIATNAYINTGANAIKELFDFLRAKAKQSPGKYLMVILDEMDALLKKRDGNINQSEEDKKIVNTFLAEMNGFDSVNNVILIGTTNRLESLDEGVVRPDRFTKKVKVGLPSQEGRIQAFKIHTEKAKKRARRSGIISEGLDFSILAQEADGLSPAEIKESINSVIRKRAVREVANMDDETCRAPISIDELIASIKHLKTSNGKTNQLLKSFSPEELQKLPEMQQAYVRDAVHQLLSEWHIKELREAVLSGKVNAGSLQWIIDGFTSGKRGPGF